MTQYFIIYISPNGATRIVAEELKNSLDRDNNELNILDLTDRSEHEGFLEKLKKADQACLLVGSPVFRDTAVPPVMAFIERLPQKEGLWAAPFVTWGLACSGVALWQMGNALMKKGCRLAGALKVAGPHSLIIRAKEPIGVGHPDETDRSIIREFAENLLNPTRELDRGALDYQPGHLAVEQKAKLEKPWMIIPKTIDEAACTQCGVCEEDCPMGAVSLEPFPTYGPDCFDCFNCVNHCPENAIQPGVPFEKIEQMVRNRVETIKETPPTQMFSTAE